VVKPNGHQIHPLGKIPLPIVYESGWFPEPIWTFWGIGKLLAPTEIWTPVHPASSVGLIKISTTRCQLPHIF